MDWKTHISDEALRAHDEWCRTRTGSGRITLEGVDLRGANLVDAPLEGMRIIRCDFSDANLSHARLGGAELLSCTFDRARMVESYLSGWNAPLLRCTFRDADMTDTEFSGRVESCDFSGSRLVRANMVKVEFTTASFNRADLTEAILKKASFDDCDFRGAVLSGAVAHWMRFSRSDFRGANLAAMRIDSALFDRCAFHRASGQPIVEGDYTIEAADLSLGFDGTAIDAAAIRRAWGEPPHPLAD